MKPIMLSVGHREPVSLLFHRAKPRNVTLLLLLFLLPRWDTDSMNQHGRVKLHFSFMTELFGLSAFCSRFNSFTRSQIKIGHAEWSMELSNFQSLFLVFRPWNEQVCLGNDHGLFFILLIKLSTQWQPFMLYLILWSAVAAVRCWLALQTKFDIDVSLVKYMSCALSYHCYIRKIYLINLLFCHTHYMEQKRLQTWRPVFVPLTKEMRGECTSNYRMHMLLCLLYT